MSEHPYRTPARRLWLYLAAVWVVAFLWVGIAFMEAVQLRNWLAAIFIAISWGSTVIGFGSAVAGWRLLR